MGYNLFQRRAAGDAENSDFAVTVASMPPGSESAPPPEDSTPPTDSQPAGLDSGIQDSLPAPVEPTVEHSPTLSHIGRYAIKGPLGHGGLGQVHEAWDPLLSRTVAVKTLQFNVGMDERVSLDGLFLNEARAAAGLSHPHIVTIHDAGLSAHGVYIAMERLYGRDLRQALAAGWQPTSGEAALLVRRVADALAYAHVRGVVHCDVKPANIFLCRRDRPKVLDFGIARVAHSSALSLLDGLVAGSPHYLAPEQLLAGPVDARTDIHALGVVFYELLAGRKAYGGDTVEQISSAVLTNHPAPPHELRPGVPPALSAIAARAMARDPAQRYSSAAAMAMELRQWTDRQTAVNQAAASAAPALEQPPCSRSRSTRQRAAARLQAGLWLGVAVAGVALAATLARSDLTSAGASGAAPARLGAVAAAAASAVPVLAPTAQAPAAGVDSQPLSATADTTAAVTPGATATATAPTPSPRAATPSRPRPVIAAREPTAAAVATPATAPLTGTVLLAISPWGQVEVDGAPAGTTPPLARLSLSEGTHSITVRNEDFPPFSATVQVQTDKPLTLRHRFTP